MAEHGKIQVLVVEDHVELAQNLFEYFGSDEFDLDFAADGLTALHLLATKIYDVIVLDLMLPGVDGLKIIERIRQDLQCETPIIIMTALGELSDKEEGFTSGADDYLVKPFQLKELKLRVEAMTRRRLPRDGRVRAGQVVFHTSTLEIEFNGFKTEVSGIPAKLFEQLIRAYPRFLSHQELCEHVWGHDDEASSNSLRTHVYMLRRLLKSTFGHSLVRSVHGRGYRLESPNEQ
jgi:DNA-binding response OmpR family regulator